MSTQTLDRAVALLRLLASTPDGCRLADLQARTGLTKPTVHRILDSLCQHDLAARDSATRRYKLGPEVGLLAASAGAQTLDLASLARDHMIEVAERTADTSFLMVRSGFDNICLDRQTGAYPVKAFTVDVGTRRPLGLGAGGLILLDSLEDPMMGTALARLKDALGTQARATMGKIKAALAAARVDGYAYSDGLVLDEVRAVAVPVHGPDGKVMAAMSIAAIRERVSRQRLPMLLSCLQTHAKAVEQRIARELRTRRVVG